MMKQPYIYVKAFAAVGSEGIRTGSKHIKWEDGQRSPLDIRRAQVLSKPYIAFGKLNPPDKLAFSVASLLLEETPVAAPDTTALLLGIPKGSLATDCAYRESILEGNPSPALFAATLPSSPIADIAIYHHLKGPNVTFAGGDTPFLTSIEYALLLLRTGTIKEIVTVYVDDGTATTSDAASPFAVALSLSCADGDDTDPVISLDVADLGDDPVAPHENDRDIIDALLECRIKQESSRIPVSAGGFIGYISLLFSRKEIAWKN